MMRSSTDVIVSIRKRFHSIPQDNLTQEDQ